MGFGHDLFQALPDSVWRRFVRKCGRGQGEHCGNWLAQVVGSLLDGASPLLRTGPVFPGHRYSVDCLTHCAPCHVPHPK